MLRIEVQTGFCQEDVISRAVKYFGGLGLKVTSQTAMAASFEGGGGGVDISTCADKNVTTVELVSSEWDSQVRDFLRTIKDKKPAKKA